jgi:putative hydrolase of the HAD superfamily
VVTKGIVFDLDDTLFLERDYVRSGFDHVAVLVARSPTERQEVSAWLNGQFELGRRRDTFDELVRVFPEVGRRWTSSALVDAYRSHVPDIALVPHMAESLDRLLDGGARLGVLSDGAPASQAAKTEALGLRRWFDPIIFTAALGETFMKPSIRGFELIAASWALAPEVLVYVGDNPAKDFSGARALGWHTIRLRMPLQLHFAIDPSLAADGPNAEISDPSDLLSQLG